MGLLLPEEQAIHPVAEQLEISERVIVPAEPVPPIVRVAEPDSVRERQRVVVPAAVRAGLDPVPARRLVWAAVETTLVIGVCPRVRALVRAATLLVAPDLAALPLRDQPAVEEAIAWAAVASAVADAAVEAVAAAEVDADDKQTIDEEGAEPNKSRSSLKNQPGTWRPQMIQDPNLRSESLANVPPT